jgi:hypothetical protein
MVTMTSFSTMNLSTAHDDDDDFVCSLLSDEPVASETFAAGLIAAGLTSQSRLVDFKERFVF